MFDLTTLDEIKARMPVTYVLHKAGHQPDSRDGRDIRYLTPWRPDSNPSLACYADEEGGIVDRWKDMARTDGGDVLDLIGKLDSRQATYPDRYEVALRLYRAFEEDTDWKEPVPLRSKGSFDIEKARAEMDEWELASETGTLLDWLRDRNDYLTNVDPGWLFETFGVVMIRGEIKAPYGDTGLYKYRRPGDKFQSPAGTRGMWDMFYGDEYDDGSLPVVLCESETDVWSGTHATEEFVFLGLPTGAGTQPAKMRSRLAGRRVLIAFDQDRAGRDAATLWANELAKNNDVEIVPPR
jgi:hypothetical protein